MKKLVGFLIASLILAVFIVSCEKDEYTEKDAQDGQEELERLRDSLARVGGIVNYTVNVINAGDAAFTKSPKSNGLSGVSVTTSQLGVITTKQTDDNGMVVFTDLRVGKVTVNISLDNYTPVSFVAELTPAVITNITATTVRSASTQVPIFPLTGSTTTTISGLITYESTMTNGSPEVAANVPVAASIDVNPTFMNTYINTSGYDGTGQIIKIAYGDAVVSGTTGTDGKYSLIVPTSASGLPIRLDIADIAIDQTLLQATMYEKDVFGVQTIRTIFSQNTVAPSAIPTVRPAYVTFGSPTGGVNGAAPAVDASAVAILSKGEIESINITNNGEGYTQTPIVKIVGDGTGATATATLTNGRVTAIAVNTKGQNYTTATVSLAETGGKDATATAVLASKLKSVTVTNGGGNYTSAPTISIEGNGTGAAAITEISGYISKVNLTSGGAGYTTVPTVTISGGGGLNAAISVSLTTGNLRSITVPAEADAWFAAVPTVTFSGTGGTEAPAATVTLNAAGRISSIPVNAAGAGYLTPPAVTISGGGGSGAVAVAILGPGGSLASIAVINKGSGYTSTPTITITAPPMGGTQASAGNAVIEYKIASVSVTTPGAGFTYGTTGSTFDGSDVLFNGSAISGTEIKLNRQVSSLTISNSGSDFTSTPTITIVGDNTTQATATAEIRYFVENIVVTNQGSGYTVATVKFTGDGSGAIATANLGDSYVSNVILTNTGSGYTAAPFVEVSGGGAPDENAIITAVLTGDKVTGFSITNAGKGYTAAPTLTIKTFKTAATADANLNAGTVSAVSVTNPGLGYPVAPIVEFVSTSGTGATATAVLDAQGRVKQINMTNSGSGYVTAPTVNLVIPNANITATGHVVVDAQGVVTSVVVDDGGNGYIVEPLVTIVPAVPSIGSGATAIAKISGGKVTSVVVTNGGGGYKGKNTPGNYYPLNTATVTGVGFTYTQPMGPVMTMKSSTPIINDIYLGTGLRTIDR